MFRPWENNKIETSVVLKSPEFLKQNNKSTTSMETVNLKEVLAYLKCQVYPDYMNTKKQKLNFRRQAKSFYLYNGALFHKRNSVRVIFDETERKSIIKMIHEGCEESIVTTPLSSHRGRDDTINMLNKRYYWPSITYEVKSYIKNCDICQQINPATRKIMPEMHSVSIPKMIFKQIGIDLIALPEVNGFRYVAVAIDYFSKWCEARPLSDKKAETVAQFIYDEIICRHGCPKIEISDQGKEFCNKICDKLFRMTGTTHNVTSPYHPQAYCLVEHFNKTIKNSLLKAQNMNNQLKWPDVLQGVLFIYRTVSHTPTKYSPFYVLYQREAVLPVDIDHCLKENIFFDDGETGKYFNEETFEETLNCMLSMRDKLQDKANKNILDAQLFQRKSHIKRHLLAPRFNAGNKKLLKNYRRNNRKGGWIMMSWLGPFIIKQIINNKLCDLKTNTKILKTKLLLSNIKKYYEGNSSIYIEDKKPYQEDKLKNMNEEYKIQNNQVPTGSNLNSDVDINGVNIDINHNIMQKSSIKMMFNSVGATWQKSKCRTLKLNLINLNNINIKSKILTIPTKIRNIIGDGNCFFRAISFWVTGEEKYHYAIRQHISKIVKTHKTIEKYIGGSDKLKTYLEKNPIENNGVWGTDVEIFGAAILLNTTIYVYGPYGFNRNEWQLFYKDISFKTFKASEKCLYIRNINNVHYDVVLDVE